MSNRAHSVFLYPHRNGLRPQFTTSPVMTTRRGPFVTVTMHGADSTDGVATVLFLRDIVTINGLLGALLKASQLLGGAPDPSKVDPSS